MWRFFCFSWLVGVFFSCTMMAVGGDLDLSFGKDGKVMTDFFGRTDVLRNLLIDADGKILVGGIATKTTYGDHFALARYDSAGTLDTSFGKDGKAFTNTVGEMMYVEDGISAFALQSGGKIVVCGRWYGLGTGMVLVRYNANGAIDGSFGINGNVITHDSLVINRPLALTTDNKDRIIVVASAANQMVANDAAFAVFRYNADGSPDLSFGLDGRVVTPITAGYNVPRAVKVDANGKIVVGGFGGNNKFVVVRYLSEGSLDSLFGHGGIATIPFNEGGIDTLNALAIQDDGKIVVGGDVQVGSIGGFRAVDFGLARLTSDGKLDLTFNQTGKQITYFVQPAASSLWALAIAPDGKIIAVGDASIVNGLGIARYNSDGSLDASFGHKGQQVTEFKATCHFEAVDLSPEGKIVVGGYVFQGKHYDMTVVRYLN